MAATRGPDAGTPSAAFAEDVAALDEFLAADVVVIGAPMYNFSVSSHLKPGSTGSRYRARRSPTVRAARRGLCAASGSSSPRRVAASIPRARSCRFDHQETYLRALFGFLGVTDITFVRAEGLSMGPEKRDASIAAAEAEIAAPRGLGERRIRRPAERARGDEHQPGDRERD